MIAFETLWASLDMTENKISEIFRNTVLPSKFISNHKAYYAAIKENVENYFKNINDQFSVSIYRDLQYPIKLRDAKYPVELFYYKGDLELSHQRIVSVVGSRKCSPLGLLRAKKITKLLVEAGFTIVSGLALGVDTVALKTGIEEGGNVIGVIGTPINKYYPKENADLQNLIAKQYLLISQVPFYRYNSGPFNTRKYYFPKRNVTMSAISEATVIVEAGESSGTLTQARAALNQERKLFILNSNFENKSISWPGKYEKKGAIRIREFEEIVSNLKKHAG